MTDPLTQRFQAQSPADPASHLSLVRGGAEDYHALAAHHYRAGRPGTMWRVLALRDPTPTASDRFLDRATPGRSVAVLVESLAMLHGRMRDRALAGRYRPWPAAQRAALLNEELRCISRVIVHPRFRGLGLAVRLVRAALADAETPLTEAYAAMGHVHPFFEKAGMIAYPQPRHPAAARLLAAMLAAGFETADLAILETPAETTEPTATGQHRARPIGLHQRIEALPPAKKHWLRGEVDRWHRQTVGRTRDRSRDALTQLRAAQKRLLMQPVYYLHDNRCA